MLALTQRDIEVHAPDDGAEALARLHADAWRAAYAGLIPGVAIAISQVIRGLEIRSDVAQGLPPQLDREKAIEMLYADQLAGARTAYVVCEQPVLYMMLDLDDVTDLRQVATKDLSPCSANHWMPIADITGR